MLASFPVRVRSGPASLEARPELFATVRLAILAGCISAAKVALFAIGGSAFLTAHGAGGLAWFYVVLALIASSTVDPVTSGRLYLGTLGRGVIVIE